MPNATKKYAVLYVPNDKTKETKTKPSRKYIGKIDVLHTILYYLFFFIKILTTQQTNIQPFFT